MTREQSVLRYSFIYKITYLQAKDKESEEKNYPILENLLLLYKVQWKIRHDGRKYVQYWVGWNKSVFKDK